jgi:hypothetical protein
MYCRELRPSNQVYAKSYWLFPIHRTNILQVLFPLLIKSVEIDGYLHDWRVWEGRGRSAVGYRPQSPFNLPSPFAPSSGLPFSTSLALSGRYLVQTNSSWWHEMLREVVLCQS